MSGYKVSSFSDVKADSYYMGYIEWANKNNIVVGVGEGKFSPDSLVTREQMAVIITGKWMYYENGRPVIGAKNIGGIIYAGDVLKVPQQ